MELAMEFASTIFLSLLLCYIIGKLISAPPTGNNNIKDGDPQMGIFQCKSAVESGIHGLKTEGRVGIVDKVLEEIDELKVEPVVLNFTVQEFVEEGSFRSPGAQNVSKTEENEANSGEGVVLCSKESLFVEEETYGGNGSFSGCEDDLFGESSERDDIEEIEVCFSTKDEVGLRERDEVEVTEFGERESKGDDDRKEGLFDEEDGWVGIERTELDRLFGAAMAFFGSASNAERISGLDNDVKTKLYGLHKIATQGPCLEPQPMALKVSARAKWNAWRQLGEMTPEMAMEQYISLVSESIPGWMQDEFGGDNKEDFVDAGGFGKIDGLKSFVHNQPDAVTKRKLGRAKALSLKT